MFRPCLPIHGLTEPRSAQDYLPPPTKRVYICAVCSASGTECQLTSCHQIISKLFQGRNGQAYAPSRHSEAAQLNTLAGILHEGTSSTT